MASFIYNGLDDRVATTRGSETRRFVYDRGGRVIGEYGASAADVKAEYIWLSPEVGEGEGFGGGDGVGGYAPLAVSSAPAGGTAQLSWVHGNHLGVPIIWSDTTGTSVAPGDYALPGFPGQSRTFADLYYNRYRDYDPTTGRYVQADPIGLDGGANPYGYAMQNPLSYADPLGLKVTVVANNRKQARALREAYYKLNQSKRGREITGPLEASDIDYQIRPIYHDAFYCRGVDGKKCKRANTVYVDACNMPMLLTTAGMKPTPLAVVLGHELGHAAGTRDVGPRQMDNVLKNENPIRRDLGYSDRTSYRVPRVIWVPR